MPDRAARRRLAGLRRRPTPAELTVLIRRAARWAPPDPVIGVLLGALTIVEVHGQLHGPRPWAAAVAVAVTEAVSVAVRARWPLGAVLVSSSMLLLSGAASRALDLPASSLITELLLVYALANRRPNREATFGMLVAVATMLGLEALGGDFDPAPPLVLAVPIFYCGRALRRWRLLTLALEEKSAALAASREAHAALAVRDERMRIARELHDVVGHAVSLMVVQASAGRRVAERRPDDALETLAAIDQAGELALADLARLAAIVAEDDAATTTLDALIQGGAGVGLEIQVVGNAPEALDPLALRVVQEALTNALKHAGPTRVQVELIEDEDALTIRVRDEGVRAGAPAPAPPSGGHGLLGMSERVALAQGTLRAGPSAFGGWEVHARLPRSAPGAAALSGVRR